VSEGLSATDVGKEIGQHAKHAGGQGRHDRALSIGEAVLLSIVTIVAAWSGYSAAKWGTESSIALAQAVHAREGESRFEESVTFSAADASDSTLVHRLSSGPGGGGRGRAALPAARVAEAAGDDPPRTDAGRTAVDARVRTDGPATKPADREADGLAEDRSRGDLRRVCANDGHPCERALSVGISTQLPLRAIRYGLLAVGTPAGLRKRLILPPPAP
jgi:hypothetical protein